MTNYRAHKDRTKKERMQFLFSAMNAEIHRANNEIVTREYETRTH